MKKITYSLVLMACSLFFFSCSMGKKDDPKETAKAFYEALEVKDYDKAASLSTAGSKTMLDLIKSMAEIGENMVTPEDKEKAMAKAKSAVYSDAEINGDVAIVKVTIDNNTNDIKLKKEEGVWKVAMDKETLKESASKKGDFNFGDSSKSLDEAMKEIENIPADSLKAALNKAGDLLKSDSIKKALDKAGDVLNKVGDALKEAGKENK